MKQGMTFRTLDSDNRDNPHEAELAVAALLHERGLDENVPVGGRWGKTYCSLNKKRESCNFEFRDAKSVKHLLQSLYRLRCKRYCFRGQYDAKWKLYSSLQRKLIRREHSVMDDSVWKKFKELIMTVRTNDAIKNTTGLSQSELFDFEIIGHLQHHGVPTPFVDFTDKPLISLYFALDQGDCPYSDTHSIYAFQSQFKPNENEIVCFEAFLSQNEPKLSSRNEAVCRHLYKIDSWEASSMMFHKSENHLWHKAIERNRIASQNGLFIYVKDHDKPLEEYFSAFHKGRNSVSGSIDARNMERIICFDFPASWDAEIKDVLTKKAITTESLGLADNFIEKYWKNTLCGKFPEFFSDR